MDCPKLSDSIFPTDLLLCLSFLEVLVVVVVVVFCMGVAGCRSL